MYVTKRENKRIELSPHWFTDGTFDTVPLLYCQFYTIYALIDSRVIPCLYALLPNKSQATYIRLLQAIMRFNLD